MQQRRLGEIIWKDEHAFHRDCSQNIHLFDDQSRFHRYFPPKEMFHSIRISWSHIDHCKPPRRTSKVFSRKKSIFSIWSSSKWFDALHLCPILEETHRSIFVHLKAMSFLVYPSLLIHFRLVYRWKRRDPCQFISLPDLWPLDFECDVSVFNNWSEVRQSRS